MRTLLVFLKYPIAGRVKTRLAESIGPERAADLYRKWIGIVLQNIQGARSAARLVACYDGAPRDAFAPWHDLVDDWWPQPEGGLGDRLDAGFKHWQAEGDPTIGIGTDCLGIDAALVESAFVKLRDHAAVFGPAADGGYYLVGLARYLPGFFEGIPWSTANTLAAHQAACDRRRWSFGLLPALHDIDTLEDWLDYQQRGNERT
ncbi:MAG: TIGR04282 family arsenosugar biosynthesis glycosyltransferase [Pirellulales bacterium]